MTRAAAALAVGLCLAVQPTRAEEVTDTASKREAGDAVRAGGYRCPAVKILWAKGDDPRGYLYKVFCGPADRDGVSPRLVYRLVVADAGARVTPWRD